MANIGDRVEYRHDFDGSGRTNTARVTNIGRNKGLRILILDDGRFCYDDPPITDVVCVLPEPEGLPAPGPDGVPEADVPIEVVAAPEAVENDIEQRIAALSATEKDDLLRELVASIHDVMYGDAPQEDLFAVMRDWDIEPETRDEDDAE